MRWYRTPGRGCFEAYHLGKSWAKTGDQVNTWCGKELTGYHVPGGGTQHPADCQDCIKAFKAARCLTHDATFDELPTVPRAYFVTTNVVKRRLGYGMRYQLTLNGTHVTTGTEQHCVEAFSAACETIRILQPGTIVSHQTED